MTGRHRLAFRLRLALVVAIAACAPAWKRSPHDRLFQRETPIVVAPPPRAQSPSDWWDHGFQTTVRPLGRVLSPGTYVAGVIGGRDAIDVNQLGQVPDSSWFENRIGRAEVTVNDAYLGGAADTGPANGPLRVVSGKLEGVSSGFVVRDAEAQIWYVKLDHPAFPELSTSAEVIASRLLWLAGYRVPSMHAIDIDRARLVLDPRARTHDAYNRSIPMTREALDALIANLNPDVTGRIRILISRQPPGRVLGSFSYRGRRADDPNDTIDHEHRRSLRGLWLFSAWINNTDTRDANSLDMFRPVTADGRGVVEHYLIDFGDSFGATGEGEKVALQSWEHLLDWPEIFKNILSVGLRYPAYRDVQRSPFRSVGLFEATYFDPAAWKPAWPNPAFDQRTRDDLFWAASILARIQPVHVQAAVTAGRYREEGASTYVIDILLARRKKLLQYGFHGYLELDRPRTSGTRLRLDDLRVLGGLSASGPIAYTVRWNRTRRVDPVLTRGVLAPGTAPEIEIELAGALAAARRDEIALADDPFLTVELTRYGGARLEVHLRVAGDRVIPVAVDR